MGGIALSADGNCLYVAETCKNRVLRYARRPTNVWHVSVFHQLSGRFGPTALCCAQNGDVYIAHYDFDFGDNSENGRILVVDSEGEVTLIMSVPGPEITGMCLTPDEAFSSSRRRRRLLFTGTRCASRTLRRDDVS